VLAAQGIAAPDAASDGDEPSGSAALADAALALWRLGAGDEFRQVAAGIVVRHAAGALAQPLAYGALLRVASELAGSPRQMIVVTDDPSAPLVKAARSIAADVLAVVDDAQAGAFSAGGFSLFEHKAMIDGKSTAFDCEAFTCRMPVTDADQLTG
jgi:uncharacterized protein YyaL (SSP411 family)